MPTYFFDTSTLKHRYTGQILNRRVCRIVSDQRWDVYVAEPTMLETVSALASVCREKNWGVKRFDSMKQAFFNDIAHGRVQVRAVKIRDVYRAMHLIRYAGVVLKSHLRTNDALIASTCLEYALETNESVIFCTSDDKLRKTIQSLDVFRSALDIRYFDPK